MEMTITYTNVKLTESGGCGRNPDLCYRYFSVTPAALSSTRLDFVYTQHRIANQQCYFNDLTLLKVHGTATLPVKILQDLLAAIRTENEDHFFNEETIKIKLQQELPIG